MSTVEAKTSATRKVCLISIDGWGITDVESKGDAIAHAVTPTMDAFRGKGSLDGVSLVHAPIDAHGLSVGLPDGLMGNSEVGHLTMGMGRVQFQDLVRINQTITDGKLGELKALTDAFAHTKKHNSKLHFLGLISDGGVHSHIDHLEQLLLATKAAGITDKVYTHMFADGRDTPPTSGPGYIKQLQGIQQTVGVGKLATVIGRYYAMDRDTRWERIQLAYDMLVDGVGEAVTNETLVAAVEARHATGQNDEFLKPLIVDSEGLIEDNDALVFIDFRADRMRQIVETLGVKKNFECKTERANLYVAGMTQYNASFNLPALFPPQSSVNVLAEWLSKQNKTQFHTAETEKYAHVTFFFNGGREDSFPGEDRQLISSPKVATYDLQPEMSAAGVAEALVAAMAKGTYDFTMCNLAPPDMVGHTGKFDETVIACTATDVAIKTILDGCIEHGYILVITSDHGNAEEMLTAEGNVKTAHSSNPVPLNIATPTSLGVTVGLDVAVVPKAGLQDVAPTVLALMGIDIPVEMTGKSVVTVA